MQVPFVQRTAVRIEGHSTRDQFHAVIVVIVNIPSFEELDLASTRVSTRKCAMLLVSRANAIIPTPQPRSSLAESGCPETMTPDTRNT